MVSEAQIEAWIKGEEREHKLHSQKPNLHQENLYEVVFSKVTNTDYISIVEKSVWPKELDSSSRKPTERERPGWEM